MDASADALVIGGGPAGLSAALYLARYNRSVLLFDSGRGRSTHGQINHNYLGFPDGLPILRLRELGREQLARYPNVKVMESGIASIEGDGEAGFTAHADGHSWHGRAVVLATGVHDHFPEFDGWRPCVGKSLFWCITCDGYENRDRSVLVIGHTDAAADSATHSISERLLRRLESAMIPLVHDRIDRVHCTDGMISMVCTRGGHELDVEAVFSIQGATPETRLARQLGVDLVESGWIAVDTEQQTSVPGVYAAGRPRALQPPTRAPTADARSNRRRAL
jgi:thioredoxin reductase (NADPH)